MRPSVVVAVAALVLSAAAGAVAVPAGSGAPGEQARPAGAADATADENDTATDRGPAESSATPVVAVPNTTAYLAIPDDAVRSDEFGRSSVDVGAAVRADAATARIRYAELGVVHGIENASSADERTALLAGLADHIEARSVNLERRQRAAIEAYNAGEISDAELLYRLARIDAEAGQLYESIHPERGVVATTGYSPPSALRTRLANLRVSLLVLQGPVRDRIARTVDGRLPPESFHTRTSDDGVVLAAVADGVYLREAFLASERNPDGTDRFAAEEYRINAAYERAVDLYPWAFENAPTARGAVGFGNTSVYRIDVDHTQGSLTGYLDGNTTNVFREIQRKSLDDVPLPESDHNVTESYTLRVNASHPTGPMLVRLSHTPTGTPINGTVYVESQRVGNTGSDGALWTVRPGGVVDVNVVVTGGESIDVRLFPNA